MSYFLVGENGYIGELASINGYAEMRDTVKSIQPYGYLPEFLQDGETLYMDEVIKEISQILPKITITSVRATLEELQQNLSKAKEIAIVAL